MHAFPRYSAILLALAFSLPAAFAQEVEDIAIEEETPIVETVEAGESADAAETVEADAEETAGAEENAEAAKERSEDDVQAAQDILRMWKQYKKSHPTAKIEDLLSDSIVPEGERR